RSSSSARHRRNEGQLVAVAQQLVGVGVALVDGGHRLRVIAQLAVLFAKTPPDVRGARPLGHFDNVVAFSRDVAQDGEVEQSHLQTPISLAIESSASRTNAMCSSRSTPSS